MMGPSSIGAQPPPEDYDEEWLMMQEDEEGDEPFCNCSTGHGIEETDWNQCDSCGKPIYDEEPAVSPAPTFEANLRPLQKLARRLTELLDEDQWAECEALLIAAGLTHNASLSGLPLGKD
jgi:acetyl-CoA carboxylase beta subunit